MILNAPNALLTVSTVTVTPVLNVITSGSSTLMVPAHKTVELETMLTLSLVLVLNATKPVPSAMEETLLNVLHVSMAITQITQPRTAAIHVITSVQHA